MGITPLHYQGATQPIDLINAQNLNFNLGNVVKYVCRAGKKQVESNLKDLEKAKDYINYEIKRLGNNNDNYDCISIITRSICSSIRQLTKGSNCHDFAKLHGFRRRRAIIYFILYRQRPFHALIRGN